MEAGLSLSCRRGWSVMLSGSDNAGEALLDL